MSKRALRQHHEKRVQKKRLSELSWQPTYRQEGRLRHNHFGCGCVMCKPWKWGLEEKYTAAERRKRLEE